jgi:transposase
VPRGLVGNRGAFLVAQEMEVAGELTQAEAAFRTVKSDLSLRPIYHQKTERVESHLLVCFLSLALWRSLESLHLPKGSKLIQNVVEKIA